MAEKLNCVPDEVTLRCGCFTNIRVRTSDNAQGKRITALGYDNTVAILDPIEGDTNADGYFEVKVTCAQAGACPGSTIVTFDATGYNSDSLEIKCESIFPVDEDDNDTDDDDKTQIRITFMDIPYKQLSDSFLQDLYIDTIRKEVK
jgi:hypothetical protein